MKDLTKEERTKRIEKLEKQSNYRKTYKASVRDRKLVSFNNTYYVEYTKIENNHEIRKLRKLKKNEDISKYEEVEEIS